jgi:hypothetical protein
MRARDSYAPSVKEGWFNAPARPPSGMNWNLWIGRDGATVLNWFIKPEEALMLHTVSPLILQLSLFLMTAVATHLVMSFGQTLLHYKVAHHPIGGKLFRNHINFHHTHYADDHLVSRTYLGDEGNITPYFLIPVFLVGGAAYFLLPLNLFVVMVIASAASFYAHVFFDKEYHVEGSRLQRFALRSSPSREQQFWCNSLLLGQDSRYLSKAECRCINQTPVTLLRWCFDQMCRDRHAR